MCTPSKVPSVMIVFLSDRKSAMELKIFKTVLLDATNLEFQIDIQTIGPIDLVWPIQIFTRFILKVLCEIYGN